MVNWNRRSAVGLVPLKMIVQVMNENYLLYYSIYLLTDKVIVQAINEYGQKCEWNKDAEGQSYTVRPIQGATLPISLRGYNLVATAETGSGKVLSLLALLVQKYKS
jgi:hypothetical protein